MDSGLDIVQLLRLTGSDAGRPAFIGDSGLVGTMVALLLLVASGPTQLGRVFERTHSSVVGVRGGQGWNAGFVIGGSGEIVLGAKTRPTDRFEVRTANGTIASARLLAHHEKLGLAVARLTKKSTVPLAIGPPGTLRPERWTLVLAVDEDGAPEPFAGVVLDAPARRSRNRIALAKVMATARPGSAVLDVQGRLIGIALDRSRRRTRVVPIEAFVAFIREAGREAP